MKLSYTSPDFFINNDSEILCLVRLLEYQEQIKVKGSVYSTEKDSFSENED